MKIVVGCHTNSVNKKFIKRYVDFHSKYATEIVLVIDELDGLYMLDEIAYAMEKGVDVILTNFEGDRLPIVEGFDRMDKCLEVMRSKNPDWMGIIATDEIFSEPIGMEYFEDSECDVYSFKNYNLWGCEDKYRVDGFWKQATENYVENIRLYRNIFGELKVNRTGMHSSLIPIQVKTSSKIKIMQTIGMLHYAFADATEWDRRCKIYGDEYKNGGGHEANPMQDEPILESLPEHLRKELEYV